MVFDLLTASVDGLCIFEDMSDLVLLEETSFHNWEKFYALLISSDMHICTEADDARESNLPTHHETSTATPVLFYPAMETKTVTTANNIKRTKEALLRAQDLESQPEVTPFTMNDPWSDTLRNTSYVCE